MSAVKALAAGAPKGKLEVTGIDLGPLGDEQVEIAVEYCGVCHSDLSMLDNEWGMTEYPIVPGHEAVGKVVAAGPRVENVAVGDTVGLGWFSASCRHCDPCMRGYLNLCPTAEQTIVNRPGAFAERVRGHWAWVTKLPNGLDPATAGPLFCGGITAFSPFVEFDVRPTDRVGIVGIGGLGHMAVQFAAKWGCEVTAFTSSAGKESEAKGLGAHHVVNSRDDKAMEAVASRFDFILVTANVALNWPAYIAALAPRGRLHFVGAVLEPVPVPVFPLMLGQKEVSASPLGRPAVVGDLLSFCARHKIGPVTESFKMSDANAAVERLRSGEARYRVVLTNDLAG